MNVVALMGRITRDTEIRYTQDQRAICRFTIAVDRKRNEADFLNCTAFGKTAENINKYFGKGDQIGITGSIRTGSYEKDGRRVYTTEIMVDDFTFGDKRKKEEDFVPADKDPTLPF